MTAETQKAVNCNKYACQSFPVGRKVPTSEVNFSDKQKNSLKYSNSKIQKYIILRKLFL